MLAEVVWFPKEGAELPIQNPLHPFPGQEELSSPSGAPWSNGLRGKESACNVGDRGSIPGLGRSPRGGHGNPLQYPCLENPMVRGAWRAAVHGVGKSQTRLSD